MISTGYSPWGDADMKIRVLVGLAALAGAAAVGAQGFTPPTFDGLDKDKNGSLSKDEVAAFVGGLRGANGPPNADDVFARWDANKDGSVSKEEFANRPRPAGPGGPPPAR
jgi:EF-hand domain pair